MTQPQQKPCTCSECGARFNSEAELEQHEKDCQNESVEQAGADTQERAESGKQRRKDEDQRRQRQDEGQRRHEPTGTPRQK